MGSFVLLIVPAWTPPFWLSSKKTGSYTLQSRLSTVKIEETLVAGDNLLNVYRCLNLSWMYLGITMFDLFQVAVQKSEYLPRTMNYVRSAAELFRKICPYSEKYTKRVEMLVEHPETDPSYLYGD